MIGRLEFATKPLAQTKADAMHAWMIANSPAYAAGVTAAQITAWALPYQDVAVWCINVKDRSTESLTVPEKSLVKPIP